MRQGQHPDRAIVERLLREENGSRLGDCEATKTEA
jgi:hypothetical protein